ncbi:MAG: hypothetical protein EAZ42_04810 [Verrucomicrobia bacterium]|nr:MAG: hypothetical protein EAZ42_04810 [Verrucomicrobiota bacterium]
MREILLIIGMVVLAIALRSARSSHLRKLGAILMLVASFFGFYFLTDSIIAGILGALLWFFLPWVDLLGRVRVMRLPLNNRLKDRDLPNPSFFPNATEAAAAMEDAGFEHVSDCGWEWAGMKQHFRLFWNPEERAVSSVCLCEQGNVAFAFISVTSHDQHGRIWRTTNFPFSPALRCPPHVKWNHVPCERSCFHQILKDHQDYLAKMAVPITELLIPDPSELENGVDREMRDQMNHNIQSGIIELTHDGHFQYSKRGMLFLWWQFIKDMVRLC